TVSTADSGSWLTLDRTSGSACPNCSAGFQIQANPAGLAPAIYHGSVTVSGPAGTVNSPRTVPVTLTILGGATLSLSPGQAPAGGAGTPPRARAGQRTILRLSGAAFSPGEGVTIASNPLGLFPPATVTADADGAISAVVASETTAAAGQYQVVATGASGRAAH